MPCLDRASKTGASVVYKSCLQSQRHTFQTCGDWPAGKLGQDHEYLMNIYMIYTEHILQCNQSEPQANASGRIVDMINENDW